MAEPILKWAGGKRQIIGQILSYFPRDYYRRTFHEPMFGAGAMTFHIEPRHGTINDINPRLMRMYEVVRDHPAELISANKKNIQTKRYYRDARKRFNSMLLEEPINEIEEASLFIYLNRTCWNGLYRENSSGFFNVPMGKNNNPDYVLAERIRSASRILKNLEIHTGDFSYILDKAMKNSIVYFDPPYHSSSTGSIFTAYHKEGFDFKQQVRLKDTMIKLGKKGVYVILSNSNTPELKELYDELKDSFSIDTIKERRNINCKGDKRGKIKALVASNVPIEDRNLPF